MRYMSTAQKIILASVGLIIVLAILIFTGILPGLRTDTGGGNIKLTIWGVFDDQDAFNAAISGYTGLHRGADIRYRQMDSATYEEDLVNALASEGAPDIIMFHNTWLPKHSNKIVAANQQQLPLNKFRELFPTVIEQDFAPDGRIFALPLYLDTLALYYNQDIFDTKGVALPPANWEEFQALIPKLRQLDKTGRVTKPAAAIGGSNKSINRATDILNLLMLQTGAKMVEPDFSRATYSSDQGLNALSFYTDFANPAHKNFTWSDSQVYSVDAFAAGDLAMTINYSYLREALKEKNPFLNFKIAPVPQPKNAQQSISFPNYWGLAVTNKSLNPTAAWDFISFLTTNPAESNKYLIESKRPPALRSMIAANLADPNYEIFAKQSLTARSWPQINNVAVENSFSKMIESVINGRLPAQQALQQSEDEINALMERRTR
ncbi:MAG: Uncharacterized protein G01um10143_401 [Parcubacteria group bacterium Gr01-1014_3]|nr:MAG: Uncharacterized protein G01um10143_401 [Parcubacteria group bacterium Gr01-1014_3]